MLHHIGSSRLASDGGASPSAPVRYPCAVPAFVDFGYCNDSICLDAATDRDSRLVLETLTPLSGDRKCFRMINGVLVERTVGDILPALQTNADGLKKVLEDLVKQYRTKQDDMEKWKKKNNIQVVQQ